MSEWVSVNDRLPELNKPVLVVCNHSVKIDCDDGSVRYEDEVIVTEGEYRDSLDGGYMDAYAYDNAYISHWMPLPEPPKD